MSPKIRSVCPKAPNNSNQRTPNQSSLKRFGKKPLAGLIALPKKKPASARFIDGIRIENTYYFSSSQFAKNRQ
jgi:hypothetical protein